MRTNHIRVLSVNETYKKQHKGTVKNCFCVVGLSMPSEFCCTLPVGRELGSLRKLGSQGVNKVGDQASRGVVSLAKVEPDDPAADNLQAVRNEAEPRRAQGALTAVVEVHARRARAARRRRAAILLHGQGGPGPVKLWNKKHA